MARGLKGSFVMTWVHRFWAVCEGEHHSEEDMGERFYVRERERACLQRKRQQETRNKIYPFLSMFL